MLLARGLAPALQGPSRPGARPPPWHGTSPGPADPSRGPATGRGAGGRPAALRAGRAEPSPVPGEGRRGAGPRRVSFPHRSTAPKGAGRHWGLYPGTFKKRTLGARREQFAMQDSLHSLCFHADWVIAAALYAPCNFSLNFSANRESSGLTSTAGGALSPEQPVSHLVRQLCTLLEEKHLSKAPLLQSPARGSSQFPMIERIKVYSIKEIEFLLIPKVRL